MDAGPYRLGAPQRLVVRPAGARRSRVSSRGDQLAARAAIQRGGRGGQPGDLRSGTRFGRPVLLAGDAAGFPNGRRVSDDVLDISARVVVGVLVGDKFSGFPHNSIGDGVNANDVPYRESFPYLGLAHSGRDSRHVDPGEPGCANGNCPVD